MNYILRYKYKTRFNFDYRELTEYMWFKTFQGEQLEISRIGNNDWLNIDHFFDVSWNKSINDSRWSNYDIAWLNQEILLTRFKKVPTNLFVTTTHKEVLSVDQRALYRFVYALTAPVAARISADNGRTWQTPDEFKKEHQLIMNMKFELANDMSFIEAQTLSLEEEEDRDDVVY